MFVVRSEAGQVAAAFLDEQFSGQEWLPIDSRPLQVFLAAAPRTEMSRVLQPESLLGRLI
jgi:hypothetical protein